MGEYADAAVDAIFGDKGISWGRRRRTPERKRCWQCGAHPLFWVCRPVKDWYLADPVTGEPHICPGADLSLFKPIA